MIPRKVSIFTKNLVLLFENNQMITASGIMILAHEMTMNERFNMISLSVQLKPVIFDSYFLIYAHKQVWANTGKYFI